MRRLAPIVLFVYNRPWHTQQTLEALFKNELADQSMLYIYCDGPKKGESLQGLQLIQETRNIVKLRKWAKEVFIIEKEKNAGLGPSITGGVSEVIAQHGRIIVLEDDLITSPGFLRYMNDALDHYADNESIMHVSAYWFPVKHSAELLPETFFFRSSSCWGWGTWQRAWEKLETDCYKLKRHITQMPGGIRRFNIGNSVDHLGQLENNITGRTNTWAVRWYATVFLNNGLCLHPHRSLVNNTGFDDSGTHCDSTTIYHWPQLAHQIHISPVIQEECQAAVKMLQHFYKTNNGGIASKVKRALRRLIQ